VPEHDIARKFEVLLDSLNEVARASVALAASGGR
jgi:GntR family transcriptional regulator/MocR family aminotransferase